VERRKGKINLLELLLVLKAWGHALKREIKEGNNLTQSLQFDMHALALKLTWSVLPSSEDEHQCNSTGKRSAGLRVHESLLQA